jgi:hypothetical protein
MKSIWISSIFWLSVGASAFAGGAPCPPEIIERFPTPQAKVLCGEAAQDYEGSGYRPSYPQQGGVCLTKGGGFPVCF